MDRGTLSCRCPMCVWRVPVFSLCAGWTKRVYNACSCFSLSDSSYCCLLKLLDTLAFNFYLFVKESDSQGRVQKHVEYLNVPGALIQKTVTGLQPPTRAECPGWERCPAHFTFSADRMMRCSRALVLGGGSRVPDGDGGGEDEGEEVHHHCLW